MSITSVEKDYDTLTITLIADFDAPTERVWQLWSDPRQLEGWWGPPTYPATVEQHELTPGGTVTYYMTSPEGDKYRGWWRIASVNAPLSLEFTDGFADDEGNPMPDMPVTATIVQLSEHDGGTRMQLRSHCDSRAHMDKLIEMGMIEGLTEAVGQMDALLAV
jgi:uncharacterized protein YndB with AHSA1/START domain